MRSEAGTLSADYQALNILYNREKATKDQMLGGIRVHHGLHRCQIEQPRP